LLNSRYFRLKHRRTGTFGLGGGDFLARKIYTIPELVIVASPDTNAFKLHEKQTRSQFTVWRELFSWEFNFADFGFQVSREKSRIWISGFKRGNKFSRISCTVFESNKNGLYMVVFVTLFATNFIEVQQCNKNKFLLDFC